MNLRTGISQNMLLKVMGENIKPEIAMAIASSPYDYSGYQTWKNTVLRIGTQLEYTKSKQSAHRPTQASAISTRQTETSTHLPRQNQTPRNSFTTPPSDVMVPPAVKDQRARDGLYVKCERRYPTKECRTGCALFIDGTQVTTPHQNKDSCPNKRSGKRKSKSDEGEGSSKKPDLGKGKAALENGLCLSTHRFLEYWVE